MRAPAARVPGVVSAGPSSIVPLGGMLYFLATDAAHGQELWTSDGTAEGTHLVKDLVPGPTSSYINIYGKTDDKLYFRAFASTTGYELGVSDGTESGTLLFDIYPGSGGSNPSSFIEYGGQMFMTLRSPDQGGELWKSDGTLAGTVRLTDIAPGISNPGINNLVVANDLLYFTANDGVTGNELWVSGGTASGTAKAVEFVTGIESSIGGQSFYRSRAEANNGLLFAASDEVADQRRAAPRGGAPQSCAACKCAAPLQARQRRRCP